MKVDYSSRGFVPAADLPRPKPAPAPPAYVPPGVPVRPPDWRASSPLYRKKDEVKFVRAVVGLAANGADTWVRFAIGGVWMLYDGYALVRDARQPGRDTIDCALRGAALGVDALGMVGHFVPAAKLPDDWSKGLRVGFKVAHALNDGKTLQFSEIGLIDNKPEQIVKQALELFDASPASTTLTPKPPPGKA